MAMKSIKLHWQILIALVLAIPFGILFQDHIRYVSWMGDVFLRALKMIVIPLIFFSMLSGVTNLGGSGNLGRIGFRTLVYYLGTTFLAISVGILLVNLIKPGIGADLGLTEAVSSEMLGSRSIKDILIGIIPENIFASLASGNTVSVIFFGILFGLFTLKLAEKPQLFLKDFFSATFDVMMLITDFIIKFAPLGIFGIVAYQVAVQKDILDVAMRMGQYILVVLSGLAFHILVSLPLVMYLTAGINPIKHYRAVSAVLLTAFSTASSNATLPLTFQSVEENCGVSKRITSFTLPLGATVNMNGTALYEVVAALFIAQAYGIDLSIFQQAIAALTALLAAIGAAGIPMAGLVTITIILSALGLPLEGVGLILAVDRPLDMIRTMVNVLGDTVVAVIIAKSEGEVLKV